MEGGGRRRLSNQTALTGSVEESLGESERHARRTGNILQRGVKKKDHRYREWGPEGDVASSKKERHSGAKTLEAMINYAKEIMVREEKRMINYEEKRAG